MLISALKIMIAAAGDLERMLLGQHWRGGRDRTMASLRLRKSSAMPVTSPTSVSCLMAAPRIARHQAGTAQYEMATSRVWRFKYSCLPRTPTSQVLLTRNLGLLITREHAQFQLLGTASCTG